MPQLHATIRQTFAEARLAGRARHRDIAERLELSEGELVAAHVGEFAVDESPLRSQRLRPDWPQLMAALEPVGEVMALTRNESCVHEKTGVYRHVTGGGHVGLVLGGAIDLRLFYSKWAHGFAVEESLADGAVQRSVQFFDAQGGAVHKVFLRPPSDLNAFAALVGRFASDDATPGIVVAPGEPIERERPDADIDVAAFRTAWASMRDTHEFFALLRRFGVSRTQGLRLASASFVEQVDHASVHEVLTRAAQEGVPIMVFVGNAGVIQIHSGPVRRVEVMGPWLNVLDVGFNLHLREDHIASAWLVRKPTADGIVHSLELFDAAGGTIAMVFGERKPGQAERCDWRQLVGSIAQEPQSCAA